MPRHYKVVIIGAGTAGLSAQKEVAKVTDDYVVIDGGPLGTTCARVGCMPSKVLIQIANDFHRRKSLKQEGIFGAEKLVVDIPQALQHVRHLRDRFTNAVKADIESWMANNFIKGFARFTAPQTSEVGGISRRKSYGSLSDPKVQEEAHQIFSDEFPIVLSAVEKLSADGEHIILHTKEKDIRAQKILVTMGRRPQIEKLNLETTGAQFDDRNAPLFDPRTFQITGTNIYFVGDVNGHRPLLHEASDQGRIAGFNAVQEVSHCFAQRPSVAIVFSEPNIAIVGETFRALTDRNADFVIGEVSFRGQGRAIIKLQEMGLLRVYVAKQTGHILGGEMIAPDGEHLAHLLVWAMGAKLTAMQILALPFYHPVTAEGLPTAIRQAARQTAQTLGPLELVRCQETPVL